MREETVMSVETIPSKASEDGSKTGISSLAFVALRDLGGGYHRGGILVTDPSGKPTEFRCTSEIKPNSIQKTLYGSTLRVHMAIELAARPLLAALKTKPDLILAQE